LSDVSSPPRKVRTPAADDDQRDGRDSPRRTGSARAVAPRTKIAVGRRRATAGGPPGDTAPRVGHRPPPLRANFSNRGRAGILCKRSADGRAVVTTPRSGRHCRWPTAHSRRPSMTCQGRVEWPRSSRAQRSRVDDTIIGLAAGHSGHAHPPACVPPAPRAPPSQVPCRRRALRAV
jgi:hypothetical protein